MLRKMTGMAALIALMTAPAYSETFEILILPDAYFPQVSYVSSGDTLVFVNSTSSNFTVTSSDGGWSTPAIASNGGTASLTLDQSMDNQFYHPGVVDSNGVPQIAGIISFGAAPTK